MSHDETLVSLLGEDEYAEGPNVIRNEDSDDEESANINMEEGSNHSDLEEGELPDEDEDRQKKKSTQQIYNKKRPRQ